MHANVGPRFFVSGAGAGRAAGSTCRGVACPGPADRGKKLDFWQVLPAAVALVFIIEGMIPFVSPGRWRNMLTLAEQMDDRVIRNFGLGSMLFGLAILYLVN